MVRKVYGVVAVCLMSVCISGSAQNRDSGNIAVSRSFAVLSSDNFPELEKIAREFYQKVVFGTCCKVSMEQYCTRGFLKKLEDAYDYDCDEGPCYAIWLLRTGRQDGDDTPSRVTSVVPDGENCVVVKYKDMGHPGETRLYFIKEGEVWKINGATTPEGFSDLL